MNTGRKLNVKCPERLVYVQFMSCVQGDQARSSKGSCEKYRKEGIHHFCED